MLCHRARVCAQAALRLPANRGGRPLTALSKSIPCYCHSQTGTASRTPILGQRRRCCTSRQNKSALTKARSAFISITHAEANKTTVTSQSLTRATIHLDYGYSWFSPGVNNIYKPLHNDLRVHGATFRDCLTTKHLDKSRPSLHCTFGTLKQHLV
jgi:hypothetical protein